MMRKHYILSDMQIPYHNMGYLSEFMAEVKRGDPTSITIIGDFMDFPSISRWNKDTVSEYLDSLQGQADVGRSILKMISSAVDCPLYFHVGNHEERLKSYVRKYAPGLASLDALSVENLLDFEGNRVTLAGSYRVVDSCFVTTHGHLGRLSRQSGQTALAAAKRINMSVVCGHSHRLGVAWESTGVHELGTRKTVWGLEVGHMMDLSTVGYQRDKVLNWQAGYGLVTVEPDGKTRPVAVEIG